MKMFLIISNPRIIIQLLLFHTKIIVQICNVQRILINWSLINPFTAGYKKSNLYIEINEHPIYLVILKFMQKWYGVQSHIGTNRSKVKDVLLISRFYILHSKIGMKITLIINILISEYIGSILFYGKSDDHVSLLLSIIFRRGIAAFYLPYY